MTKNMTGLATRASLAAIATVLLIAPAAHAQRDTRITSKSVEAYAELLELDAEQIEIAKALHAMYLTAMSAEPITPAATAEASLFDDLRLILNDEQAQRWVRVERLRRRETLLTERHSAFSAGSLNLIDVTKSVGGSRDLGPEVAAALNQYEIQLDRALVARSDASRRTRETSDNVRRDVNALFDGHYDNVSREVASEAQRRLDMASRDAKAELRRVRLQLRNMNDRFARSIESLLPADLAPAFRTLVLHKSFRHIYLPSKMDRLFIAVGSLDDLTDEQRLSLSELRVLYTRDRAAADKRWSRVFRDNEDGTGDRSAVDEARKARFEMEDRYEDKLFKLLNLDQQQRLPPRSPRRPIRDFSPDAVLRDMERRALEQAKAQARDKKPDR